MTTFEELPAPVRAYLTATPNTADALGVFTTTAVVVDDGQTYRGSEEIRRFLTKAGAEFTYTSALTGLEQVDDAHWVVTNHLEGDFPGGVVDLRFRFALAGDRIEELVIAP